jgi:hypothetical protein
MNPTQDTFESVVEHTIRSTTLSRLLCRSRVHILIGLHRSWACSVTAVAPGGVGAKKAAWAIASHLARYEDCSSSRRGRSLVSRIAREVPDADRPGAA